MHYFEESLRAMEVLGHDSHALDAVRRGFPAQWTLSEAQAPIDVWCGEVVFKPGTEPLVLMYPNSAWGRLPSPVHGIATQTGMDHMVAHLVEREAGRDFGELAACRDQVWMMLTRGTVASMLTGFLVAAAHRLHKQIPVVAMMKRPVV